MCLECEMNIDQKPSVCLDCERQICFDVPPGEAAISDELVVMPAIYAVNGELICMNCNAVRRSEGALDRQDEAENDYLFADDIEEPLPPGCRQEGDTIVVSLDSFGSDPDVAAAFEGVTFRESEGDEWKRE